MLEVRSIRKKYGPLEVLKGIDLTINKGEIVSIVGSSGAGKTTLLQLMGTLDKPDSGEVLLNGVNPFTLSVNKLAEFRNTQIGFVFQFHQLLPEFTALENVMLPALIGGKRKADVENEAMELLKRLRLGGREKHLPSALSGGEQQRVAVARALIINP